MDHVARQELVTLLPRLRRFAYSLTGSLEDADDVLQTACERALSRYDQFTTGTRFDSWLFQIVRNAWIDKVRYQSRRKHVTDDSVAESIGFDARIPEQMQARIELDIVRREMANLPEEQRVVLGLVTVDGMSYQDAAEALGIPIGTIMSRLSRARRRLADAIETGRPRTEQIKSARHAP